MPVSPLIIPFFIPHAGCPHICAFCNQRLISGVEKSLPTTGQITETVLEWVARSPARASEVAFYGGSFTLLPQAEQRRLLEAVQPLIDRQLVLGIRISTRPDALDGHMLTFLAAYRVQTIEIGVQSLDDQVLQQSVRGHTASDSLAAIRRVRAAGFKTGVQLLPGLPGDNREKALAGVYGVIEAGAQLVRIYPAVVLAGTRLAELFSAGEYSPPDLEQGVQTCARMLHICLKKGIPVIRTGLQADESLQHANSILAGCWHPALGQLVRSELYYDLICSLTDSCTTAEPITLICHPSKISEVIGNRRHNLQRLNQHGILIHRVEPDDSLAPDSVALKQLGYYYKGSIVNTLHYKE